MAWRQGGFKPEGGVRNVCPGVINRESFKRNLARSPRGPCELSKITGRRQPRPVFTERRGRGQPVEKPLYASSGSPSRTHKLRHCSVLVLISKCFDAVLDYPPLL